MPKPLKQVRFSDLVKASGNPEQVTLWAKPEAGSPFLKAVENNQVATVVQHNTGTKKDFGVIGFQTLPNATFLLFPNPLPYAAGTKIVGIDYKRLAKPPPKGALYKPAPPKPSKSKVKPIRAAASHRDTAKPAPAPKAPKQKPQVVHRFRATVELIGRQEFEIEVIADSLADARSKLKEKAGQVEIDEEKMEITRNMSKPRRAAS